MSFSRLPVWVKLWGSFCKRLCCVFLHGVDKAQIYEGFKFGDNFDKSYELIVPNVKKNNELKRRLKGDAVKCFIRWGFTPRDFFLFGFHDKNTSTTQRKTFVSDYYKDYTLFSKEGPEKYAELFDKTRFLNRINAVYLGNKGGYMLVNKQVKKEEFVDFSLRYSDLFIKPNSSSYGNGAMIALIKTKEEANALYDKLEDAAMDWIVEKRIVQSEILAKWNASSVNTVRVNTFLTDRGFFVLGPFLRTGRKGSIVDNGGKGGVMALLDERSGEILTDGRDENGTGYVVHPDSGIPFKGGVMPDWDDLLKTVEKVHRDYMSDHIYISWDFAHTDEGWRVIEGNWGQFICQQSTSRRGFKRQFKLYLKGNAIK